MSRRLIALVLGAAILTAAAAPADAGRPQKSRQLRRVPRTGHHPHQTQPRGGVLGAGWMHMAHAAEVARPGAFRTGLPRALVELRAAPGTWGRQRKSQWCWAAASQMVLNYLGLPVSQEHVILRAYGGYLDRPASPLEIAFTLNGWTFPGALGIRTTVGALAYDSIATATVVSDLANDRPLIVGLRNPNGQGGHAYVVTAVSYDIDPAGRAIGRTVTMRDPWPDSPGLVEVSWGDFASRFIGAVRIDVGSY